VNYPQIDTLGPSVILGPECFGVITKAGAVSAVAYRGVWYAPVNSAGADLPADLLPLDAALFPIESAPSAASEANSR
jgi:hypothetical protein